MKRALRMALSVLLIGATFSCSESLTTREKGAGVGTVMGATMGAGIGSIWDYAVTGGMVGAGLGLVTGALIGDHFQQFEKKRNDLDRRIEESERELQRLCDELEKLKKEVQENNLNNTWEERESSD